MLKAGFIGEGVRVGVVRVLWHLWSNEDWIVGVVGISQRINQSKCLFPVPVLSTEVSCIGQSPKSAPKRRRKHRVNERDLKLWARFGLQSFASANISTLGESPACFATSSHAFFLLICVFEVFAQFIVQYWERLTASATFLCKGATMFLGIGLYSEGLRIGIMICWFSRFCLQLQQSSFCWIISVWVINRIRLFWLRFRWAYDSDFQFSLGWKCSYNSVYNSNSDSITSGNQP